jgi:hypothetical protein
VERGFSTFHSVNGPDHLENTSRLFRIAICYFYYHLKVRDFEEKRRVEQEGGEEEGQA